MQVRTLILGAGAAGLFCAAHAGPDVLVVDHAKAPGEKIRISGGGRCNFTNLHCDPSAFLGQNPHFHKSALSRYTQWDFIAEIDARGIAWHEKEKGQLFCDGRATQIIEMLTDKLVATGATLWLETEIGEVAHSDGGFRVVLRRNGRDVTVLAQNLVLATGGKSIPKMGATGRAYQIAEHFDLAVTETRPALVPFTFADRRFADISGVSTPTIARADGPAFDAPTLFTHRGLSGPAMLQISSYWQDGQDIEIDLMPGHDIPSMIHAARQDRGRQQVGTILADALPARLVAHLSADLRLERRIADMSRVDCDDLSTALHKWRLRPGGTEGYRTAEVTLGGIDTDGLSSKTMEARDLPGLYAIGEAVDVTGWLGGYNFQWAWSSAFAAGMAIAPS